MSRSHAHRPAWARLADPTVTREVHDHRHGPCDLPPVAEEISSRSRAPSRCHREVIWHLVPPSCGCPLCTAAPWRREQRRRDRHRSKDALRRWEDGTTG